MSSPALRRTSGQVSIWHKFTGKVVRQWQMVRPPWVSRVFFGLASRSFPGFLSNQISRQMPSWRVLVERCGSQRSVKNDRLEANLPFLASVGSTSPYIGLFGTVWGIMHSFRGLANATQATLATVAPGISEALIATAMGLFAAIPAVLAYNRFAARSDSLINRYDTFVDEFSGILQRQTYAQRARRSAG